MIEFFASAYFLGILLMVGGCVFFLNVFFPSWYYGYPHRFWITRLTYANDNDQQSFVRFMWLCAWIITLIGSLVATCNHPHIQNDFWWGFVQTLYGIVLVWSIAKAIVALCIIGQYIGYGIIRLKQWIFNDKPLFRKHQEIQPLER